MLILILLTLSLNICIILEVKYFPKKHEISLVSYNIHSGLNKDYFPTLFDIIEFLRVLNADIICLQEVNESAKAGFQVSSFKDELNMYSHFGANVVKSGSNYGLVTYTKYPIKSRDHIYLTSFKEQRALLHTIINIKGKKLNIINLHLGLTKNERDVQLKELNNFLHTLKDESYIIAGDFNEKSLNFDRDVAKDIAIELNKENTLTISTGLDRIDYILVSPNIEIIDYEVLIKNMSDHFPIIAKIKI